MRKILNFGNFTNENFTNMISNDVSEVDAYSKGDLISFKYTEDNYTKTELITKGVVIGKNNERYNVLDVEVLENNKLYKKGDVVLVHIGNIVVGKKHPYKQNTTNEYSKTADTATEMGFSDWREMQTYVKNYTGKYWIIQKRKKDNLQAGALDKNGRWTSVLFADTFTKEEANEFIKKHNNSRYYYEKSIPLPDNNGRLDIDGIRVREDY